MERPGRLWPTLIALAVGLALAFAATSRQTLGFRAFTAEDARRLTVASSPLPVSPLHVIDAGGDRATLWDADPATRIWLVSFVYTRCTTICAALGSEFAQLQSTMSRGEGVRLASLSFDRAHDTPAALAAWAKRERADPGLWLVAVPESEAALARLLREAGVVAIEDGLGGFTHNAAIHVVTSSGQLVAIFDLERHSEALAFARGLAR